MSVLTKSSVSTARQHLIELMRQVQFGQITSLTIAQGEPDLSLFHTTSYDRKLDRPEEPVDVPTSDFALKSQVVALFALFDELQDFSIDRLEIKHGLPFRVHWGESDGCIAGL